MVGLALRFEVHRGRLVSASRVLTLLGTMLGSLLRLPNVKSEYRPDSISIRVDWPVMTVAVRSWILLNSLRKGTADVLNQHSRHYFYIIWTPGNVGMCSNEEANTLARALRIRAPQSPSAVADSIGYLARSACCSGSYPMRTETGP